MTDARFAVDQEPSWSPWRDTALALLAEAHLLAGNRDRAVVLFVEASTVAAAGSASDAFIVSESELAVLAMDRGRWQEAAEHVDHALGAIAEQRLHDYSVSLLAFAGAARLAVHRGDVKEAHRQLTCAMRARPSSTFALPYFAVRLRLQLAKVYAAIGNVATARHLLHEIEDIFLHRPALGALVDEVSELREILSSSAHPDTSVESPLSPAELRLLPYLQTHLTMREIGERLSITRHTVSSEVGSIYRKLGVSSRGDAVLLATALGLLGG